MSAFWFGRFPCPERAPPNRPAHVREPRHTHAAANTMLQQPKQRPSSTAPSRLDPWPAGQPARSRKQNAGRGARAEKAPLRAGEAGAEAVRPQDGEDMEGTAHPGDDLPQSGTVRPDPSASRSLDPCPADGFAWAFARPLAGPADGKVHRIPVFPLLSRVALATHPRSDRSRCV